MVGRLLGGVGGSLEGVADEHDGFPLVEEDGAQAIIEVDGRLIPVEDFPTHAEVIFIAGDAGHVRKQGLADSLLPEVRPHINIFEEQAGTSLKCGVELEEDGVAGGLSIQFRNDGTKFGFRAKTVTGDGFGRDGSFAREALILRELENHRGEERCVVDGGRAYGEHELFFRG